MSTISANEIKPSWHEKFVCAMSDEIVLDFDIYQGADALLEQVEEPQDLGLGSLVIGRLSQTPHPNIKVYCDRFFISKLWNA